MTENYAASWPGFCHDLAPVEIGIFLACAPGSLGITSVSTPSLSSLLACFEVGAVGQGEAADEAAELPLDGVDHLGLGLLLGLALPRDCER
jgi:hypothetical protein